MKKDEISRFLTRHFTPKGRRQSRRYSVSVEDNGHLRPQGDKKVVFHGVNKSGSRALATVLMKAYAEAGRGDQFHSQYHMRTTTRAEFLELLENRAPPAFFVGHDLFARCDWNHPDMVLITQFRHPLPRTVSIYHWLKNKYRVEHGSADAFPSLEKFVIDSRGKSQSQAAQFGLGFGPDRGERVQHLTTREILERCKENVDRYVYSIGIAEYFEETIFLAAHVCGIRSVPVWKRDDRNVGRPMVWNLPQATINLIEEVYATDFELYEWAKRRFLARLEDIKFGGSLKRYKRACADQYKDRILEDGTSPRRETGEPTGELGSLGGTPRRVAAGE